jgi:hypothetical protein
MAVYSRGQYALERGDWRAAVAYYEAAAAILRSVEDLPALSLVLGNLAIILPADDAARSAACAAEALTLAQAVGTPLLRGWVTFHVGNGLLNHGGDLELTRGHLDRALQAARTLGADSLELMSLGLLAEVAIDQGRTAEATSLLKAVLPLCERLSAQRHLAMTCLQLAQLAQRAGDGVRAAANWHRALTLVRDFDGNRLLLAPSLAGIARLLSTGDQVGVAVRLLAATDTVSDAWDGGYMRQTYRWFREDHSAALQAAQAALGEAAFAQAWTEGEALSLEQAADLALAALADLADAAAADVARSAYVGETH